jgi:hypothetical protein
MRAATLGAATFLAVLGLGIATMPAEEVQAEAPAPAAALARVGQMNEEANAIAAQRVRRGASAL